MVNDTPDQALRQAEELFESLGYEPSRFGDGTGVKVELGGRANEPLAGCYVTVDREEFRFVTTAVLAQRAPQNRRHAVSEFFTRMNAELVSGWFSLDLDTGAMGFRNSFSFRDACVPAELVRNSILEAVSAVEAFIAPLTAVVKGSATAEEAARWPG